MQPRRTPLSTSEILSQCSTWHFPPSYVALITAISFSLMLLLRRELQVRLNSTWRNSPCHHVMMASHFIHKNRNLTGCNTVKNHGEMFLSALRLLAIVDAKSTVSVYHKTIERFATTFFRDIIAFHTFSATMTSAKIDSLLSCHTQY